MFGLGDIQKRMLFEPTFAAVEFKEIWDMKD